MLVLRLLERMAFGLAGIFKIRVGMRQIQLPICEGHFFEYFTHVPCLLNYFVVKVETIGLLRMEFERGLGPLSVISPFHQSV
jgi:hypothetical protein